MVDTQKVGDVQVHKTDVWLHKADFSAEGWAKLLDNFGIDEDIRDRAFAIDIWDADVIAKPAREGIIKMEMNKVELTNVVEVTYFKERDKNNVPKIC